MSTPTVPPVGTELLPGLLLGAPVRQSDSCDAHEGQLSEDGSPCTIRVWKHITVDKFRQADVAQALARAGMHAVGLSGLLPLHKAGVVAWDGEPRLITAHACGCSHRGHDQLTRDVSAPFPASPRTLVDKLAPVTETLSAIHDQGLTHGWLNPHMVCLAPRVTLDGFGLSLVWRAAAPVSNFPRTTYARYLAPEMSTVFTSPDPSVDIYALALLFIELLRGTPIDVDLLPGGTLDQPSSWDISIPKQASELLSAALAPHASARPDNIQSFWGDLHAALASKPSAKSHPAPSVDLPPTAPQPRSERSHLLNVIAQGATTEDERTDAPPAPPQTSPEPPPTSPENNHQPAPEPQAPPPQPDPQQELQDPQDHKDRLLIFGLVGIGALVLLAGIGAAAYMLTTRTATSSATSVSTTDAGSPDAATTSPPYTGPAPTPRLPPLPPGSDAPPTGPGATAPIPTVSALDHKWLHPTSWPKPSKQDTEALIPIDLDTPLLGAPKAAVTLMLFAGLQGRPNKAQVSVLSKMLDEYPTSLRVAVRLVPKRAAPNDQAAAMAGFNFYFKKKNPADFWTFLTDPPQVPSVVPEEEGARKQLTRDQQVAAQLMVTLTPTVFVNGKRFNGFVPLSRLRFWVDEERKAAKAELIAGTKQELLYSSRTLFWVTSGDADRPR